MDSYRENKERHVLIVNTGGQRAYSLEAAAYSVGRDVTNAIVLDFDTVSRQHALLLRVPNPNTKRYEYRIVDGNAEGKASANGIYINGEAVKSHTLKNGDSVEFGEHVKAAYLTLSMGEAEFLNYLESISYQSLKSDLVDSRATAVVGSEANASGAQEHAQPSRSGRNASRTSPKLKSPQWKETAQCYSSSTQNKDIGQDSKIAKQPKGPINLWILVAAGVTALAIAAGGFLMLNQSQSQPSEVSPSSVERP